MTVAFIFHIVEVITRKEINYVHKNSHCPTDHFIPPDTDGRRLYFVERNTHRDLHRDHDRSNNRAARGKGPGVLLEGFQLVKRLSMRAGSAADRVAYSRQFSSTGRRHSKWFLQFELISCLEHRAMS